MGMNPNGTYAIADVGYKIMEFTYTNNHQLTKEKEIKRVIQKP